ncbi:tryptophan-rich sensory protein [Yoonia sp. I 8.24]|uniref:tryptophan-rich sensory protein n=1 Tax=Yoonia sp. I 8.24 TaxID=1537229 RepID=UPI001EDEA7E1|nr:tryptophan-rich sensory protein [Yoonia sp. I 8.24]MCG3269557.1 hypothetical protein [Yoonia sp. I 8.24]
MKRHLALVVLISTLTFVFSPLATRGFNGFTPDQFPVVQIDPPVQPAGYAFSIWGVIYLWLLIGAGYGVWRAADDPGWQAMRTPLAISLIIGTFWIAAANAAPILATFMIVAMAALAILAMLRAGNSHPWLQVRPVALYAGWLTAASGVAIGVLLGGYAVVSAQSAAIICLICVLAVALKVQSARPREWGYPIAVVWALLGVIVQNASNANWPVIALATLGIAALVLRTMLSLMKGPST